MLWGCLTVLEVVVALIALPVAVGMLAFGNTDGWWVLLVALGFLIAVGLQAWWTRRMPGPWL